MSYYTVTKMYTVKEKKPFITKEKYKHLATVSEPEIFMSKPKHN